MQGEDKMCGSPKLARLREILTEMGSVAVAFSGGVDSAFLLKAARDALGNAAVAVTASAPFFAEREKREAEEFCRKRGIPQLCCTVEPSEIDGFSENPPDRCYLCKRTLMGRIRRIAEEQRIAWVAEGSNVDDCGDYRPGMRAIQELGIRSPLREAELSKQEIRQLSRELGLPTWDKPSAACLASRFAYGERITREKLRMVERAEELLSVKSFGQARVRLHGTMARIELLPEEFGRLLEEGTRKELVERFEEYGFSYVSLDLKGYRTGSMNEALGTALPGGPQGGDCSGSQKLVHADEVADAPAQHKQVEDLM